MLAPPRAASLFAALGDETRLHLVARLSDGRALSISHLTQGSNLTRQAITKHLRVMEDVGLVSCERHGRESLWTLENQRVGKAQQYLAEISKQWDNALDRLKQSVEE